MKVIIKEAYVIPGNFRKFYLFEMSKSKDPFNYKGLWTQPQGGWFYQWKEMRPYTKLTAVLLGVEYEEVD